MKVKRMAQEYTHVACIPTCTRHVEERLHDEAPDHVDRRDDQPQHHSKLEQLPGKPQPAAIPREEVDTDPYQNGNDAEAEQQTHQQHNGRPGERLGGLGEKLHESTWRLLGALEDDVLPRRGIG